MEVIFYSQSPFYPPSFPPSCSLLFLPCSLFLLVFIISVSSSSADSMSGVALILSGWSSVASTLMRKGTRCLSTSQTWALNTRMNFWAAPKDSSLLHWLTGEVKSVETNLQIPQKASIHSFFYCCILFSASQSCLWVIRLILNSSELVKIIANVAIYKIQCFFFIILKTYIYIFVYLHY